MSPGRILCFRPAEAGDAKAVATMRIAANEKLTRLLGPGPWTRKIHVGSIRERIRDADVETLRRSTLFVLSDGDDTLGSVIVSTYSPGFWKQMYWQEGRAHALGVFNLVVHPDVQSQGLGKRVMNEVERLAQAHSLAYVRLDAYAFNPYSVGFYRAIGYDERAQIDLRGCDLVLFEKRVL